MLPNRVPRPLFVAVLLAAFCLGLTSPATAGINTWTSDGLYGGEMASVAADPIDPLVVYAAARQGGFWKSTDGGDSWFAINEGIVGLNAEAVATHPNDSGTVFAMTNGTVYRSLDGGGQWSPLSPDLDPFFFGGALLIDATDPTTLYAGSLNNGVLKSTDGGQTWTVVGPEGLSTVGFLSQDPNDASVIYAGGFSDRVWRSADGGATWTPLAVALVGTDSYDLAVDPLNGQILWLGTRNGLYRSLDGGASWNFQNSGLGNEQVDLVEFDPRDPQVLYAGARFGLGVARSTDSGATWTIQVLDRAAAAVEDMAFAAGDGGRIHLALGRGGGVYRSLDDGLTWQWSSEGLTAAPVTGIAVDPSTGTILAAVSGNGIFRRQGAGDWQPMLGSPRDGECCFEVRNAPGMPGRFYASGNRGVFLSDDGGLTWLSKSQGLPTFIGSSALKVDRSNSQRLFLTEFGGIYRSLDGGDSWQRLEGGGLPTDEFILDLALSSQGGPLFAAVGNRIYRSDNGGTLWQPTTDDDLDFFSVSLAVDPLDASKVVAGTSGSSIQVSSDGGRTWQSINVNDFSFVFSVTFDDSSRALAVTDRGLWRSEVGGTGWGRVGDTTVFDNRAAFSGIVESGAVTRYFAGTLGGSVYSLTEACIPSDTVLCIDDDPGDRRFALNIDFATSQGSGGSGAATVTQLDSLGISRGGIFSFFGEQNPEVLVKVIDGCGFNLNYWLFAAATTNVGYTLSVQDTRANLTRVYTNADGTVAATVTDTGAFATCGVESPAAFGPVTPVPIAAPPENIAKAARRADKGIAGACVADGNTLCIDDLPGDRRFAVTLSYDTALGDGASGDAMATSLAALGVTDGGILSFFDVTNPEVLIKVIDGCEFNGHYWVFYAAATNLGFQVTVEDTQTGVTWDSQNPDGVPAATVTDTEALATCGPAGGV